MVCAITCYQSGVCYNMLSEWVAAAGYDHTVFKSAEPGCRWRQALRHQLADIDPHAVGAIRCYNDKQCDAISHNTTGINQHPPRLCTVLHVSHHLYSTTTNRLTYNLALLLITSHITPHTTHLCQMTISRLDGRWVGTGHSMSDIAVFHMAEL